MNYSKLPLELVRFYGTDELDQYGFPTVVCVFDKKWAECFDPPFATKTTLKYLKNGGYSRVSVYFQGRYNNFRLEKLSL